MKIKNNPEAFIDMNELKSLIETILPSGHKVDRVEPKFKRCTDGMGPMEIDYEEFIGLQIDMRDES